MNRALVVDDNESSRRVVSYILSQNEMAILEAEDGQIGLPFLLNEKIDLVVLDWKMPTLGGKDLMIMADSIIKQVGKINHFKRQKIKIVLYTSIKLEELNFPQLQSFDITGYVYKGWSIDQQKLKFKKIVKNLSSREAA